MAALKGEDVKHNQRILEQLWSEVTPLAAMSAPRDGEQIFGG
jgi:hypothetical protein